MKQEHFQEFKSHKKPKQVPLLISRRELNGIRQGIHGILFISNSLYLYYSYHESEDSEKPITVYASTHLQCTDQGYTS